MGAHYNTNEIKKSTIFQGKFKNKNPHRIGGGSTIRKRGKLKYIIDFISL